MSSSAFLLSFLIGVVAGLRTMMGPTAVSWAARLGLLSLAPTSLAFLGYAFTPWILTVAAIGELIGDQLPTTPSRLVPMQFGGRIISGGLAGAAIGAGSGSLVAGLVCGMVGAVVGTLGGHAARRRLGIALGNDHPAAFIEDGLAIGGALLIVMAL